jgi:hypothetical protein
VGNLIAWIVNIVIAISPGSYDVEPFTPWKGWAAFVVSGDLTLGMGWGATVEEAEQKAFANCRKKSQRCAEEAAITNHPEDRVAHICCQHPARACIVGIASKTQEAISSAESFAEMQEWGRCNLIGVYSARSGMQQ